MLEPKFMKGVGKAIAKLEGLSAKVKKDIITKAFKEGALVVRDAAREAAPRDTGNLKRKIKIVKVKPKNPDAPAEYLIGASVEARGYLYTDLATTKIKTRYEKRNRPAYYSDFLEKGYFAGKRHFRKGASDPAIRRQQHDGHKFIPPKPYLVPAFEKVADRAIDVIGETIDKEILKEIGNGG